MAGQQRAWVVTVAWPESGQDLDLYVTLSAGGQTTSGIGWNNGSQTPVLEINSGGINGTFYAKWGGDNTQVGGHETITIYFNGTLPAGHTQVATVTPHCNYYHKHGSGESAVDSYGAASITVDNQSGTWTVSEPSQHYGTRATASDPSVDVPLYADGGTPTPFPNLTTVTLDANGGSVNPSKIYYADPTSSTTYGTLPTPTRSSGHFIGWFTARSGGTQVTDTSTLVSLSSHTLYAHWRFHITVVAFNSFYVTLNGTSGLTQGAWTAAEGDFIYGDTITITASAPNPTITPFKAWYLNPSAWGNPEQTGTLVPGAGATYTFTATADATYFATFDPGVFINIRTEYDDHGSGEAPDAVVSINGQSSGGNKFNLQVARGSSATVGTTEYGGAIDHALLGTCRLYFMGWIDRAADPSSSTIISTALQYAFQATQSYRYDFIASYRPFLKLTTAIMANAAYGSISTSPTGRDGEWFEAWTDVTLTATPSNGYRFVKWTAWESWPGGQYEYDISTNAQISIEVQDYDGKTIRAYFEWDGTDLLVNSFNRSTPVQLVYDPATNKLVADY